MESTMVYDVVRTISCILEIYFVVDFYNAYSEKEKKNEFTCWHYLACVAAALASMYVNSLGSTVLNVTVNPLIYLILRVVLFDKNIWAVIREWLIVLLVMIGVEFVFVMLQSIPVHVSTDEIFKDEFMTISSILSVELIKFAVFFLLKQFPKSLYRKIEKKLFLIYVIQMTTSIAVMISIPYIRPASEVLTVMDTIIVVLYVIVLFGNICLLYFLEKYNREKDMQLKKEIELTKYYEKQKYYDEIDRINKKHAIYIHDMSKYLKQIAVYADKGSNTDILDMIDELNVEFLKDDSKVYCSNILLNAIVVDLVERAKAHNIETDIFVEQGFGLEHMRDMDITMLFGNAFDNALEAAQKCENGYIQVKLFRQNEGAFSVIRIVNTYAGDVICEGRRQLTTKNDKELHGIGIRSMQEIVDKYNGLYAREYEDDLYRLIISVPNR